MSRVAALLWYDKNDCLGAITNTLALSHTHTHTNKHTQTNTHTHTHTHTHINTSAHMHKDTSIRSKDSDFSGWLIIHFPQGAVFNLFSRKASNCITLQHNLSLKQCHIFFSPLQLHCYFYVQTLSFP